MRERRAAVALQEVEDDASLSSAGIETPARSVFEFLFNELTPFIVRQMERIKCIGTAGQESQIKACATHHARGIAHHQGIIWDSAGNDCACADDTIPAYRRAGQQDRIFQDACIIADFDASE